LQFIILVTSLQIAQHASVKQSQIIKSKHTD